MTHDWSMKKKNRKISLFLSVCLLIRESRNLIYPIEKKNSIRKFMVWTKRKRRYHADVVFVLGEIGGIGASLCNFGICGSRSSLPSSSSSVSFDCRRKSDAARSIAKSDRWTIGLNGRVSSWKFVYFDTPVYEKKEYQRRIGIYIKEMRHSLDIVEDRLFSIDYLHKIRLVQVVSNHPPPSIALEVLKEMKKKRISNWPKEEKNKPSLTAANFGSDRWDFSFGGTFTGGGRVSIVGFRGLITSHLTRILNQWKTFLPSKSVLAKKPSRWNFIWIEFSDSNHIAIFI